MGASEFELDDGGSRQGPHRLILLQSFPWVAPNGYPLDRPLWGSGQHVPARMALKAELDEQSVSVYLAIDNTKHPEVKLWDIVPLKLIFA